MTADTAPAPLEFHLCARKEGARVQCAAEKFLNVDLIEDPRRAAELAIVPPKFKPQSGTFQEITDRADKLNLIQIRSGFLDYFYFPEVHPGDPDGAHCDACKRIAIREALTDE